MMTSAMFVLAAALSYPETRTSETSDVLHGVEVADPYRWLENDDSEETAAWVAAQNRVTHDYLDSLPGRDEIRERLGELWNFERTSRPREFGERWFFTHNRGLQNQAVLMMAEALDAEPQVLLDPNLLSEDGTVALANWRPSEDGKLLAWSVSRGGSDWHEVFVRNIETGEDLDDHLKWVKFSGLAWHPDGEGFYYSRYPAPEADAELTGRNENHQLWFHRLGTPQSEDRLIYSRPDHPNWGFRGRVTEDGNFLVVHIFEGTSTRNRIFYQPIDGGGDGGDGMVELLHRADASYDFVGNRGSRFYFRTNLEAPRYRVVAIDLENPERAQWTEIVSESDDLLEGVSMVGGRLVCQYLRDARSAVRLHGLDGAPIRELELPGLGSASGFGGRADDTHTFYSFSSFTNPGAIHRYDLERGTSEVWWRPEVDFDGDAYETRQAFVESADGTKIPVFVVHRKGLKLDGSHRTLLYGYGGFNISQSPGFSVARAVWLERGGVFVLACIRGGGEYGKAWHEAGIRMNKQNSYDDFIAAAEWLIEKKYTSRETLAIQGGSNGGLLVGACMTQRPELFGACLPAVGVMDLLRFHRFTIGWAWVSDYGSPDDARDFANLHGISPYHNLEPGTRYPATLVTTADHDDRVVPAHSFKFAARLQACQAAGGPPTLIRIDTSAGHGAGTALDKVIARVADQWAFLEANL